ncbi:MAG: MGMT family protein [Ignavibacteria bacterium]|nr:MGMT family protein [Ignavibacteria bacterium]
MAKHSTWSEKLLRDNPPSGKLPRIVKLDEKKQRFFKAKNLLIPAPMEVDELMRRVPKGKLTTINDIRAALAKRHKAEAGCPITTGIFVWIASHATEEQRDAGKKRITPYWRTLKNGGELNPKYPGGIKSQTQTQILRSEDSMLNKQASQMFRKFVNTN